MYYTTACICGTLFMYSVAMHVMIAMMMSVVEWISISSMNSFFLISSVFSPQYVEWNISKCFWLNSNLHIKAPAMQ